jgi:hypothetical protein
MNSKITGAPIGNYLIAYGGPRYYFTHRRLKSQLFFEGGVGAYNFNQKSYSNTTGQAIDQINDTRAGLTGGIGGSLALSTNFDILAKGNFHTVFTRNGSSNFITVQGGIELRFR